MKSWEPNKLVQDDEDIAYEPDDKKGQKLAYCVTMYLRLLMWRVKMNAARTGPIVPMSEHQNCRCVIRPIDPAE